MFARVHSCVCLPFCSMLGGHLLVPAGAASRLGLGRAIISSLGRAGAGIATGGRHVGQLGVLPALLQKSPQLAKFHRQDFRHCVIADDVPIVRKVTERIIKATYGQPGFANCFFCVFPSSPIKCSDTFCVRFTLAKNHVIISCIKTSLIKNS